MQTNPQQNSVVAGAVVLTGIALLLSKGYVPSDWESDHFKKYLDNRRKGDSVEAIDTNTFYRKMKTPQEDLIEFGKLLKRAASGQTMSSRVTMKYIQRGWLTHVETDVSTDLHRTVEITFGESGVIARDILFGAGKSPTVEKKDNRGYTLFHVASQAAGTPELSMIVVAKLAKG